MSHAASFRRRIFPNATANSTLARHSRNGWRGNTSRWLDESSRCFCLGVSPKKSSKDGVGKAGAVLHFGDVAFRPGAFAYGDRDGLLVSNTSLREPTATRQSPPRSEHLPWRALPPPPELRCRYQRLRQHSSSPDRDHASRHVVPQRCAQASARAAEAPPHTTSAAALNSGQRQTILDCTLEPVSTAGRISPLAAGARVSSGRCDQRLLRGAAARCPRAGAPRRRGRGRGGRKLTSTSCVRSQPKKRTGGLKLGVLTGSALRPAREAAPRPKSPTMLYQLPAAPLRALLSSGRLSNNSWIRRISLCFVQQEVKCKIAPAAALSACLRSCLCRGCDPGICDPSAFRTHLLMVRGVLSSPPIWGWRRRRNFRQICTLATLGRPRMYHAFLPRLQCLRTEGLLAFLDSSSGPDEVPRWSGRSFVSKQRWFDHAHD
ncbi:hypothetical protein RFM99_19830 [Mesorhizobium sp. VK4C]|uniref:RraA family protein n=1 Tax=Mesorhizobium captivum TaxID=3072319 RepID=UPI002A24E8FA|nr:hypothetical protein [Mesorhizobium sp. VK4C]MDX8500658.1 hypothetical protein [Mesorhizobium sp. VK4C]